MNLIEELKEKYIQFCCDFYNEHAPEDKIWFGRMFDDCHQEHNKRNSSMYRWQFPLMILKDSQTEIDQLKEALEIKEKLNKALRIADAEKSKRIDAVCESIDSFFDDQVGTPTQREYCNFIAEIKQALRGVNDINHPR